MHSTGAASGSASHATRRATARCRRTALPNTNVRRGLNFEPQREVLEEKKSSKVTAWQISEANHFSEGARSVVDGRVETQDLHQQIFLQLRTKCSRACVPQEAQGGERQRSYLRDRELYPDGRGAYRHDGQRVKLEWPHMTSNVTVLSIVDSVSNDVLSEKVCLVRSCQLRFIA